MLEPTRMQAVQSPIIPIVGELIRQHPGTISLGQGVVSYPPPPEATEKLTEFFNDRTNHLYQSVQGISPLLEVIEAKLQAENDIAITDENCIVVTAGGNMAFNNAVLAITQPGDEIVLQTPYYFNHEMAVMMAGCRRVLVNTDDRYQLRPEAIEHSITDKTRAVVTISPNNPTGAVYPEAALQTVNRLCRERGIYHIHDEAYEYFTYDGVKHVSPASFPNSAKHTISLFSLSKAYGFASWRIGYMVFPKVLLDAVKKIQDTILICPPVVSQYAALGALQVGKQYCEPQLQKLAAVRQLVLERLEALRDICSIEPSTGAFYVFLKVKTSIDSLTLVERLIREYRVAAIPGTTFGMEDGCYLRVAYGALQKETVEAGIDRLVRGLRSIVAL
ncbi:MAG: pyridoxal phosphate-dependent aminotransferase [Cyanobacteria bacterium SID2]|nr:pyridoxal phosphate-dependent aminotransferase [Cyanobacteria bacterium SID2]MBP0006596.1 pyridoxal phosphate-dependent aminotransferase [Cyanobacteria bacterium SBC]